MIDAALMRMSERLAAVERELERRQVEVATASQIGYATGSSSSPTTTSTSYVDLDGMSVTLTTTGGPLIAWMSAVVYNSAQGNAVQTALRLDSGTEIGEDGFVQIMPTASNYWGTLTAVAGWTGVSAGSHTVKGRWKTGAGTATALFQLRTLVVLEVGQ